MELDALELQIRERFTVGHHPRHGLDTGLVQRQQNQPWLPLDLCQHQRGSGLLSQGQGRDVAVQTPTVGLATGLQFNAMGAAQAIERQAQQHATRGRLFGPRRQRLATEGHQGRRRQLVTPQRHLAEGAALGLEQQHQFGHAQAAATRRFRDGQGLQTGFHA
ncbi:hypothetical protein D3C85_1427740 [compost metagenome]